MLERSDTRRYHMLEVIGKGGFGKVYRARLDGPEGFVKEVAVKLLNDTDAPESILRRFRDESRILGLVRDRAVIGVDPPTRLDGRWAVVMEYVDGVSVAHLVRAHGPLPARVALEIVAETARALDKLYHQPGPDGQPLRVLHRDIKPQNLQLTPGGQVKILDFGIAQARFEQRESHTTTNIGGTVGFIPPERLEGEEGPAGDIFALGVTLRCILTGRKPSRRDREQTDESLPLPSGPGFTEAMALAERMSAQAPEDRPTARQVEDEAASLADALPKPDLRRWAEANVPSTPTLDTDALVGSVLTETMAAVPVLVDDASPPSQSPRPARRSVRWLVLAVGAVCVAGAALGGLVVASLGAGFLAARSASDPVAEVRPVEVAAPVPAPAPVTPTPAAEPPPVPEPPIAAAPTPAATPAPTTKPVPRPAAAPAGPKLPVLFSSVPMGAEVYVDGTRVGVTPLQGFALAPGAHQVRMKLGADSITRDIRVDRRAPSRFIWKGGTSWSSEY